ncbi:hypothetical protein [Streptomyces mirabilis]|uniref:hypothetical protein n=1 Tax=Streptomyces mirabilis TaxID=68239 RepID=UPI0036661091
MRLRLVKGEFSRVESERARGLGLGGRFEFVHRRGEGVVGLTTPAGGREGGQQSSCVELGADEAGLHRTRFLPAPGAHRLRRATP